MTESSINFLFRSCMSLFQKWLVSVHTDNGQNADAPRATLQISAMDQYGRFKIWGEQSGASRAEFERGSLDERLLDQADLRQMALDTLDMLQSILGRAFTSLDNLGPIVSVDTGDESSSESTDSDSASEDQAPSAVTSSGDIRALVSNISRLVQVLYHFASLLRRPTLATKFISSGGKGITSTYVQFFVDNDRYHIQEKIRQWSGGLKKIATVDEEAPATTETIESRKLFPDDADTHLRVLIDRLGRSNTRRREQLRYWLRHGDRAVEQKDAEIQLPQAGQLRTLRTNQLEDPDVRVVDISGVREDRSVKTTTTKMDFSTVATSVLDEKQTIKGYSKTVYEPSICGDPQAVRIPPVPQVAKTGDTFICPYCFAALDSVGMQNRQSWKRHVFRDLRPYVCTFAMCQNPHKMYATRHDWIYHEMQMHRRQWVCPEPCDSRFEDRDGFAHHLRAKHTDWVSERQFATLLGICERPIQEDEVTKCPLCPEAYVLTTLQKHLSTHLEELALFVVPAAANTEQSRGSNEAAQSPDDAREDDDSRSNLQFFDVTSGGGQAIAYPMNLVDLSDVAFRSGQDLISLLMPLASIERYIENLSSRIQKLLHVIATVRQYPEWPDSARPYNRPFQSLENALLECIRTFEERQAQIRGRTILPRSMAEREIDRLNGLQKALEQGLRITSAA